MNKHDLNEPAFPIVGAICDHQFGGMAMRDYFAAKALPSVLTQDDCGIQALRPDAHYSANSAERAAELWARNAYEIADAMLAERAK
jgi:hypothetical protein